MYSIFKVVWNSALFYGYHLGKCCFVRVHTTKNQKYVYGHFRNHWKFCTKSKIHLTNFKMKLNLETLQSN